MIVEHKGGGLVEVWTNARAVADHRRRRVLVEVAGTPHHISYDEIPEMLLYDASKGQDAGKYVVMMTLPLAIARMYGIA